ncbi:winged helix-turn-helix transcriptional regulator [Tardiphaga alba]|uniref:winged helix-turn-helix transcriptional regulator n=1 Tax=Tardiphaga alba TaxID=340268 RepID=UPI0038B49AE5
MSQRHMARELGVALGLANAYLKRCVRKGLIKVQQAPRRRYAYYLTPHGFAEKTRLTGDYLSSSLRFFRTARAQISSLMKNCVENGWKNIALVGVSELAEIATLCRHDVDIKIVGIVDHSSNLAQFSGLPVVPRLADLDNVDAVIVTAMRHAEKMIGMHCCDIKSERVLAPRVLRLPPTVFNTQSTAES